jgi:hypothetical protein
MLFWPASLVSPGCEDTSSLVSGVFMRVLSLFPSSGCCCGQSQPPNPFQNSSEQLSRNRHLRRLEDCLSGMADDLQTLGGRLLPENRRQNLKTKFLKSTSCPRVSTAGFCHRPAERTKWYEKMEFSAVRHLRLNAGTASPVGGARAGAESNRPDAGPPRAV